MGDRVKNSIKKSHNSKKIHVGIQNPKQISQEERMCKKDYIFIFKIIHMA